MQELVVQKERAGWRIPNHRRWRTLFEKAKRHIRFPKHVVVTVGIVGDRTIARLNSMYRGKQKITDVLSFQYTKTKTSLEGDIIISLPQARRQARVIGNTTTEELSFLFVHGLLHLFGYDHEKNKSEERRMFALQDLILGRKK